MFYVLTKNFSIFVAFLPDKPLQADFIEILALAPKFGPVFPVVAILLNDLNLFQVAKGVAHRVLRNRDPGIHPAQPLLHDLDLKAGAFGEQRIGGRRFKIALLLGKLPLAFKLGAQTGDRSFEALGLAEQLRQRLLLFFDAVFAQTDQGIEISHTT